MCLSKWRSIMCASWRIREAIKNDAESIIKLLQDMIAYHEMQHKYKGVSLEEFLVDCFGPTPWVSCIVAESNDCLIGYSAYYYEYKPRKGPAMYMIDLFVVPSERGKGLGQALIKELSKIAVSKGCIGIRWDIDPGNTRAINFYERLGATVDYGKTFMSISGHDMKKLAQ